MDRESDSRRRPPPPPPYIALLLRSVAQNFIMQTDLFPFPLVAGNIEGLTARHHRGGKWIYATVVLALLVAAAALPFVSVDVSSRSRGILRPALAHSPLTAAVTGRVTRSALAENAAVVAGDTLLVISTAELGAETEALHEQIGDRRRLLTDLEALTATTPGDDYPRLTTAVYQRDYQDYRRRLEEARLKVAHTQRHHERQRTLFATETIARAELEQAAFEHELATGQLRQLREQQGHLWTQERQRVGRELRDLSARRARLGQRATDYVVTAPVSGHLTQVAGLQPGAFATAGQSLAVISPDGDLHLDAFVSPADIGLLRDGMEVRVQLDAFNHNQWGLARATVADIGRDVTEVDGQPVFRVRCTLHDRELTLGNGYVGRLKKGMTATTHFTLARRTLGQLLYDKLEDWIKP